MSQKTKQTKALNKRKFPQGKPYRTAKEVILENVVMSDTIKAMPVVTDHIVEMLKDEVRLKSTKKRHVNLYVPKVDENEKPTGEKVKLKADITPWGIFVFEPKEHVAMKDGEKVIEKEEKAS